MEMRPSTGHIMFHKTKILLLFTSLSLSNLIFCAQIALPYPYGLSEGHEETPINDFFKVAVFGDSLLHNFHVSNKVSMLAQMNAIADPEFIRNGLIDLDPSSESVNSFSEQLSKATLAAGVPALTINLGTPGSNVVNDPEHDKAQNKEDWISGIVSLKAQVDRLAELSIDETPFTPDLVISWLGHNDINLLFRGYEGSDLERSFAEVYRKELTRALKVLKKASDQDLKKRALIVFTIGNLESALKARDLCELEHIEDPKKYPEYEKAQDSIGSLQKTNRAPALAIAKRLNDVIRNTVSEIQSNPLFQNENLKIYVSEAFANMVYKKSDLSLKDAFHPSPSGFQKMADVFLKESKDARKFINPFVQN